jgi:hypothetical protein
LASLLLLLSLELLERRLRLEWWETEEQLPVESDLRSEASDLIAVLGVHIGQDGVCALLRNHVSTHPPTSGFRHLSAHTG